MATEEKKVAGDGVLKMIRLEEIRPSMTNPRKHFDEAALAELTENIRAKGIAQPLLTRPLTGATDGVLYELVAGARRLRACTAIGLDFVPCYVRELSDQDALEFQLIENLQRTDLDPLEEAEGYEKLMESGEYSAQDLAGKVGKTGAYIYARLKLLSLPEAGRTALLDGRLTLFKARKIACLPHPEWREEATGIVLAPKKCKIPELQRNLWGLNDGEVLSDRQTTELITTRYMRELKNAPFDQKDPLLNPEQGPCTTCPLRAGNAKELFPDLRADTCTNPKCFLVKQEKTLADDAAKQGAKVLSEKEREKIFYENGELYYDSPYVELENQLSYSEVSPEISKRPSWKSVLKGLDVPVILAVDGNGKRHVLVDHKLALEAAKEAKPELFRKRGTSAGSEDQRKETAKRKRDEEIQAEVFADTMDALEVKISKGGGDDAFASAFLAFYLDRAAGFQDSKVLKPIMERRKIDGTMEAFVKTLKDAPAAKLALAIELMLTIECRYFQRDGDEFFVSAYKIDRKKIETQVKASFMDREEERLAKAPTKPAAKATTKPPAAAQHVMAAKNATAKAESKATGRIGERIVRELKAAGAAGVDVKTLSAKLAVKPGNVFSWFYTTGKKVKGIIKVGEAKYGFREAAVAK